MQTLKKIIKNILVSIKLMFITSKENKQSNSNTSIIPDTKSISISDGIEKDEEWFTRANNLLLEFAGNEPIVYESDMRTIRKQSQYGYIGKDRINEPDELLADDVELVTGITRTVDIPASDTVEYLNNKQTFEARWEEIKRRARLEVAESDIDDETENIDGIIKEN